MGNSNDCCSSLNCSFVKKDQHAQEYDDVNAANRNIRKNAKNESANALSKEA